MEGTAEKHPTGRSSPDVIRPDMSRRIVLVGKTGAGKSSSGNTILGRKAFRAAKSSSSITKECWKEVGEVAGREVVVVDSPGLFDTTLPEKMLKQEIAKCINMTSPGPHAIIVVIQLGPFTEEERLSVEKVRAIFGDEADRYTMVLFTHGDDLDCDIEEYVNEAQRDLKHVLSRCGQRYHVFDNTDMSNRNQVLELFDKIDNMVETNGEQYYTSDLYKDTEKKLRAKEEELRQKFIKEQMEQESKLKLQFDKEEKKLQEEIERLKESEREKEMKIKELQRLITKRDLKMREYKRYYEGKLRAIREEAEQTQVIELVVTEVCSRLQKVHVTGLQLR